MVSQTLRLRYLIPDYFPEATDFIADEVEERIYFDYAGEMQARIDRENERVVFECKHGEDWYLCDWETFEEVNERNEAAIF